MRVLTDFHHSSLLRSLVLLFEDRLEMELYRPIGMEWFEQGFWGINNQADTAKQFLDLDQAYKPSDGTPPLNMVAAGNEAEGAYLVVDPGGRSGHKACTLPYFLNNRFDYVIASIPAHVEMFERLIKEYQPWCKLIVQMGNNWNLDQYPRRNILASIAPQPGGYQSNIMFYHQEFDLDVFRPTKVKPTKKIYSFVNVIENSGIGWLDYQHMKRLLPDYDFKAFGGQCPDGSTTGPAETAEKMREAQFIFHVKPGGDGFGHVIHNAYAVGRPVITRPSHYRGQLAEQLLVPGTFVDLDRYGPGEIQNVITMITENPDHLERMGQAAAQRFREVVNYDQEAIDIANWLEDLPSGVS